jgi:hypothetical protein
MRHSDLKAIPSLLASLGLFTTAFAQEDSSNKPQSNITPATSAASISKVNTSTLIGKVMVGYNGWYTADGDGSGRGWAHWTKNKNEPVHPQNIGVELFPDLSEFGPEERFPTSLKKPDGTPVEIYSSLNEATVRRHFQWMHDYRIDGAFIKRFALDLKQPRSTQHTNTVLANARKGAAETGRAYAVMYVLDGMGPNMIDMLIEDWRRVGIDQKITQDPAYLRHEGKPLVAIKGVGFKGREYSLEECERLASFIKDQGCSLMIGTSADWLEGGGDSIDDPALLRVLQLADVISPWGVGRYQNPREVRNLGQNVWTAEKKWCDARGIDYLPVIYPGYSQGARDENMKNLVPRRHGKLLWAQFQSAKNAGCEMTYVATFDGMHNGTAILKFDKTAPQIKDINGIGFEDLPSDYYLKLTGDGGMLIKNAIARRSPENEHVGLYSLLE